MEGHQGQGYLNTKEHKTTEVNTNVSLWFSKIPLTGDVICMNNICKALTFAFLEVKLKFHKNGEPSKPFLAAEYLCNQEFMATFPNLILRCPF